MIHGLHNVVGTDTERYGHVDIEFRDDESGFGRNCLRNCRVDSLDIIFDIVGVGRNISHNGGKDEAVVLKKEPTENDGRNDSDRNKAT